MGKFYSKPHLSIEQQLALLKARGLEITDEERCQQVLTQVGYYRIAAYLYPFRKLKPRRQRTTQWNYRYDDFEPGHSFTEAVNLYKFDEELRTLVFEGLTQIEVALRTSIAYHAGKRDKFIHLHRAELDENACSKIPKYNNVDSYTLWKKKYKEQLEQANGEDYIRHHLERYGSQVPIWIATEFLAFGSIVHLFNYLPKDLKTQIANTFGAREGNILLSWVRNFNYVRNTIAHHSRLWNRLIVVRVKPPHRNVVGMGIVHLAEKSNPQQFNKIYPTLALIAYSLSHVDPESNWNVRLANLLSRFPEIDGVSPENDMGFPADWNLLPLWTPRNN